MNIKIPLPVFAAIIMLAIGAAAGTFVYGLQIGESDDPGDFILELKEALSQTKETLPSQQRWGYHESQARIEVPVYDAKRIQPGLTLLTGMGEDSQPFVRIIEPDGTLVHEWIADWYKLWPDAEHVPESLRPKRTPPTIVHGIELMPNNDIVFNFEYLGMIRLDACGAPLWRLPQITHHSIFLDDDGNIWAGGRQLIGEEGHPVFTHLNSPRSVETVVKISPDGEKLDEIFLFELLADNDLSGYLFMGTMNNLSTEVGRPVDITHFNDVEIFPKSMKPGVFKPGDILLSPRNLNSIFVVDPDTKKIKYWRTGGFVRQHDPDFVDGNTISIFDNNNVHNAHPDNRISRILTLDARTSEISVRYPGVDNKPFYSAAMGKHQNLPNGNLLITSSFEGRAIEVNEFNRTVWEYINIVDPGSTVGVITEATRLPESVTAEAIKASVAACSAT